MRHGYHAHGHGGFLQFGSYAAQLGKIPAQFRIDDLADEGIFLHQRLHDHQLSHRIDQCIELFNIDLDGRIDLATPSFARRGLTR